MALIVTEALVENKADGDAVAVSLVGAEDEGATISEGEIVSVDGAVASAVAL